MDSSINPVNVKALPDTSLNFKKKEVNTKTAPYPSDRVELSTKDNKSSNSNVKTVAIIGGIIAVGVAAVMFFRKPGSAAKTGEEILSETSNRVENPIKETAEEIFSFRPDQYKIDETKKVETGRTVEDTVKLWKEKLDNTPKTENGKIINHKTVDLTPHNYDEKDIPKTFIHMRTYNADFSAEELTKEKMKKLATIEYTEKILPDSIKQDFSFHDARQEGGKFVAGVTKDGKNYVTVKLPTGRIDESNREGFAVITMVSPNNKFTQVQKDLISAIHKNPKKPFITTQSVIDNLSGSRVSFNNYDINYDVMLSEIYSLVKKDKGRAPEIINKMENLKSEEYITNLENMY